MATKKSTSKIKSTVSRQVKKTVTPRGEIDLEALRERAQPLAEVLDEFILSKSTRTDPRAIAKDLALVLDARDPGSRLAKALAKLEKEMSSSKKASGKKSNK